MTVKPPAALPLKKTVPEPFSQAFVKPENANVGASGPEVSTLAVELVPAWVPWLPTRSEIL